MSTVAKNSSRRTPVKKAKRPMVSFGRAIVNFWRGYFDFTGRATRAEYWFGMLFFGMALLPVLIVLSGFFTIALYASYGRGMDYYETQHMMVLFSFIVSFPVLFPCLALGMRRFRDAGVPALLFLIPMLVSWLLYLVPMESEIMAVLFVLFYIPFWTFGLIVVCLPSKD